MIGRRNNQLLCSQTIALSQVTCPHRMMVIRHPREGLNAGQVVGRHRGRRIGRSSLTRVGERCLHWQEGLKETDRAASQHRFEFGARLTKERARAQSRRKDCLRQFAKVRGVLDERL